MQYIVLFFYKSIIKISFKEQTVPTQKPKNEVIIIILEALHTKRIW